MVRRFELLSGFRGFTVIWLGQVLSLLGTGMTRFALTIWAYQMTGSATALAMVAFFSFGPTVLLSPIAGALVDRWNRKLVMMLGDLGAGLATVALLLLYVTGNLQVWHLFAAGAFASTFEAFQFPAFSAAVTMMLPKEQYARASGMMSMADSIAGIAAPILAGILTVAIGITFMIAVSVVLLVRVPQPKQTSAGAEAHGSLWQESLFGFRYILQRPSLLGLQLMFFQSNLFANFGWVLLAAMILARTGKDELALGTGQSMLGLGGLVGGLWLSVWGGPKRKVHGVLMGMIASSLLGTVVLGVGQSLPVWLAGAFFTMFLMPIINGSNQAIWQAKVAPDVQGRVFAARRLIAQITAPLAMILAGPLADRLFEPALRPGGPFVPLFGGLVGSGPGAGIGLIFVLTGLLGAFFAAVGYLVPAIRNAEEILPDYVPLAEEDELVAASAELVAA
ncbi:MAG TPA: MFS transporter [Caldilineaceae bacterium]|nr:MFS transporter [Caldilineaceae bacterium]